MGTALVFNKFACPACGSKVRINPKSRRVQDNPVTHSFQVGKCVSCGDDCVVVSAKTNAECVALEPFVKVLVEHMGDSAEMDNWITG